MIHLDYIQPSLVWFKDYDVFEENKERINQPYLGFKFSHTEDDKDKKLDRLSFEDCFNLKRVILVGEPGFGKSRLLKELIINAEAHGKKAAFIDLKSLEYIDSRAPISTALQSLVKFTSVKDLIAENLDSEKFILSDNFTFENNEDHIYCFDALDEVSIKALESTIERLKDFASKITNASIIISCRVHHLERVKLNRRLFTQYLSSYNYVNVQQFTPEEVKQCLSNELQEKDVDKVVALLRNKEKSSILQTPRYLNILIQQIQENKNLVIENISKTKLLDSFIYRKLDIESGKSDRLTYQQKEIIKRVLEKLALIMEMKETNSLSKEEVFTILEEVKSNLGITFLSQVQIEEFFDHSLLKDNVETIEFETTTLQEYLSAKELHRLSKDNSQIFFDVVIDADFKKVYPHWYEVIENIIELDIQSNGKTLVPDLINLPLLSSPSEIIHIKFQELILNIEPERIPVEWSKKVFQTLFTYYQENSFRFRGYYITENLARHYHVDQGDLLSRSIQGQFVNNAVGATRIKNLCYLLRQLLIHQKLSADQKGQWQKELTKWASQRGNAEIQAASIRTLAQYKDLSLLASLNNNISRKSKEVFTTYVDECFSIDPDSLFSLNLFLEGIERGYKRIAPKLIHFKSALSINRILDYWVSHIDTFRRTLKIDKFLFDTQLKGFLHNVELIWDAEIEKKIEHLVKEVLIDDFHSEDLLGHENRIIGFVKVLSRKKSRLLFELASPLLGNAGAENHLFKLEHRIFPYILRADQVEELSSLYEKSGRNAWRFIVTEIRKVDNEQADAILAEARKVNPAFFQSPPVRNQKTEEEANPADNFRQLLKRVIAHKFKYVGQIKCYLDRAIHEGIYQYYEAHKVEIQNTFVSRLDKLRLRVFRNITQNFLNGVSPFEERHNVRRTGPNTTNMPWSLSGFEYVILTAHYLGIDLSLYLEKVFFQIPFDSELLVSRLKNITGKFPDEYYDKLTEAYKRERTEDWTGYSASNIIYFAKENKLQQLIPLLKYFLDDNILSSYDKSKCIDVVADLAQDELYLSQLFAKYNTSTDPGDRAAAIQVNNWLITLFENEGATKWRLNELRLRIKPFVRPVGDGVRGVSDTESEMDEKHFAKPLMTVKNPKYLSYYLELLEVCLLIYKKNTNYYEYTKYVWDIVTAYLSNLKSSHSISYLNYFKEYFGAKKSLSNQYNIFKPLLEATESEYLSFRNKAKDLRGTIRLYNHIIEREYLNISSSKELLQMILDVVDIDLKRFIEMEGFYRTIRARDGSTTAVNEDFIQKTIVTQIENGMLKRGARKFDIRREVQLYDNKRIDLLISYGFIRPVLVEVKLTHNKDLEVQNRSDYKKKLLQYLEGTNAAFGIYLLFQVRDKPDSDSLTSILEDEYSDLKQYTIRGLRCIQG